VAVEGLNAEEVISGHVPGTVRALLYVIVNTQPVGDGDKRAIRRGPSRLFV